VPDRVENAAKEEKQKRVKQKEKGEEYLTNYAQTEVDAGRTPTQEQIEAEAINFMYDEMKEKLAACQYADPVHLCPCPQFRHRGHYGARICSVHHRCGPDPV